MNKVSKQHLIDIAIGSALVIFFFALCYYAQVNEAAVINSDNAFPILAGQAMFNGNPLLEGWIASTRSYYFDSFIYGAAGQLFGYDFRLVYKVSAFAIALLFAGMCYIVLRLTRKRSRAQRAISFFLAISLCLTSVYIASDLTQSNWAASHVFAAIVGLALIWNLYCMNAKKRACSIGYVLSLLFVVAAMGDYLLLYFAILPAGLVLLQRTFSRKNDKKSKRSSAIQLVLLIAAVVMNRLVIFALESAGGMPPSFDTNSVALVLAEEIPGRIFYVFECILTVFNGDLFGKAIKGTEVAYYLVGLAVSLLLVALVVSMRKKKKTFLDHVLVLSVVLTVFVLCFTSYAHSNDALWDTRLMYYLFFALVILFSCIDWKIVNDRFFSFASHKRVSTMLPVALILVLACCGVSKIHHTDIEEYREANLFKVADELQQLGLNQGYAPFWLSDVITLASDSRVEVVGIVGPDPQVFRWLAAPLDSIDDANFVLMNESGWRGLTKKEILDTVGIPREERQIGDVTIMIYDKNIMPYIKGSGVSGIRQKSWWSLSDDERTHTVEVTGDHFQSDFEVGLDGCFESNRAGYLLFGPYEGLSRGTYNITFNMSYVGNAASGEEIGEVDLYSNSAKKTYATAPIVVGSAESFAVTLRDVELTQDIGDIETRVYTELSGLSISSIDIERVS